MKVVELLALDVVQAGMKVAEAVLDHAGKMLVPAGAEVSEVMLNGLRRREVASLKVEREVEENPAALEARRAMETGRLERIFRQAGDAVETRTLFQAVLNHRMAGDQ